MKLQGVHHVSVNVADIDEATRFYTDVLGLEQLPRPDFGFPGAWLKRVESCLRTIPTQFNTDRMVAEYAQSAYRPLAVRHADLRGDRQAKLSKTVARDQRIHSGFQGIEIVSTERGGDITYHGPGQLVAYGIIDLKGWAIGPVDYVHGLEAPMIKVCADWGLVASRKRSALLFGRLLEDGFTTDQLRRVSAPCGLDLGSETPQEIALSILAEILRHSRGGRGTGQPLRELRGVAITEQGIEIPEGPGNPDQCPS